MIVPPPRDAITPNPAIADRTPDEMQALRRAAEELEASFLAEMLKHAGFGAARETFGGGIGEDQFSFLLRGEHARSLARQGGIGLAESLFQSLVARQSGASPRFE